ncbi:hypothetical protein Efla_002907 [Eimeria flavescens]
MPKTIVYEWSETATHLSLLLRVPSLKPKSRQRQPVEPLSVILTSCFLRVCRAPLLLELDLWGDVCFRAATISSGAETIFIVVPKSEEGLWESVAAVSNPQLQPAEIAERRRLALAAYAEWQQELRDKRVAKRHAHHEQQQKLLWQQQQQQREWHKQQKDLQVQQVLQQLDEEEQPASRGPHYEAEAALGERTDENEGVAEVPCIEELSDAELEKQISSSSQATEPQPLVLPNGPVSSSTAFPAIHDALPEEEVFEGKQVADHETSAAAAAAAARPVTPRGLQPSARDATDEPKRPVELLRAVEGVAEAHSSKARAGVINAPLSATQCTTISVSFAPRRPNRVPARGPRAPPLPKAAASLNTNANLREKPGDLSRLQQKSPRWLQSKAARLLSGGDAASAAETYTASLRSVQQKEQQHLLVAKILCGRSLAWLALGECQKALSDCTEGLAALHEVQLQEEAAAAAAGQPCMRGPLQAEAFRLHHVFLARRAAAFLRLDNLEQAANSLEELQNLQKQHMELQEEDGVSYCNASDRAAVTKDLQNVRRLQENARVKEEADLALRMALGMPQEQQIQGLKPLHSTNHIQPEGRPLEAESSNAAAQLPTACNAPLLHFSVALYVKLLSDLLQTPRTASATKESDSFRATAGASPDESASAAAEPLQTSSQQEADVTAAHCGGCDGDAAALATAESTAAVAREVAAKFTAAAEAVGVSNATLACAATGAAVLTNMALALLQLQQEVTTDAARAAATAASALVNHVETQHKLQQVDWISNAQPSRRQAELHQTDADGSHAPPIHQQDEVLMACSVSVLHKVSPTW